MKSGYIIDIIRELESGKIRKVGLARSALTFAVSVAVKPATIHAMPTNSINNTRFQARVKYPQMPRDKISQSSSLKILQIRLSHHYRDVSARKIMMIVI